MEDLDKEKDIDKEQGIEDPSKNGIDGLRSSRFNQDYLKDYMQAEDLKDNMGYEENGYTSDDFSNKLSRNAINEAYAEDRTRAVGGEETQNVGHSSYDDDAISMSQISDINEFRADDQGTVMKWVNGIGKFGLLTATSMIDSTIGNLYGIGSAIVNGDITKLWDNDLSNALREVEEEGEDWMPNYYSKEEMNNPWYKNMLSANFWADGVLKNCGYTVGTMLGTAATLLITGGESLAGNIVRNMAKLGAKGFGKVLMGKGLNQAEKLGVSLYQAASEARGSASMNTKQWTEEYNQQIMSDYMRNAEELNRELGKFTIEKPNATDAEKAEFFNNYNARFGALNNKLDKDRKDAENKVKSAACMDFALETALLLCTNLAGTFAGYRTDFANAERNTSVRRGLLNLVTGGKHGKMYKADGLVRETAKEALSEGFVEEGVQGVVADMAHDYYSGMYDDKCVDSNSKFMMAFKNSLEKTYGHIDNYDEIMMGAITGITGVAMPHKVKDANGNERWQIMQGGVFDKSLREEIKNNKEVADYLNKRVEEMRATGMPSYIIKNASLEEAKARAAENNDKFSYKNAEYEQLVNDVMYWKSAGRLDDLKGLLGDPEESMSKEDIDNLIKCSDATKDNKLVNALGLRDEQGNSKVMTDKDYDEVRNKINKQKTDAWQAIEDVSNAMTNLDMLTGGKMTSDELKYLTWVQVFPKNLLNREKDMIKTVVEGGVFKNIGSIIEDDRKKYRDMLDIKEDKDGNVTYSVKPNVSNMSVNTVASRLNSLNKVVGLYNKIFNKENGGIENINNVFAEKVKTTTLDKNGKEVEKETTIGEQFAEMLSELTSSGRISQADSANFFQMIDDINSANYYRGIIAKEINKYVGDKAKFKIADVIKDVQKEKEGRDVKKAVEEAKNKIKQSKETLNSELEAAKNVGGNDGLEMKRNALAKYAATIEKAKIANIPYGSFFNEKVMDEVFKDQDIAGSMKDYTSMSQFTSMLKSLVDSDESMTDSEKKLMNMMIDSDGSISQDISEMSQASWTSAVNSSLHMDEITTKDANGNKVRTGLGDLMDRMFSDVDTNEVQGYADENMSYLAQRAFEDSDNVLVNQDGTLSLNEFGRVAVNDEAKRIMLSEVISKYKKLLEKVSKYTSQNNSWGKNVYTDTEIQNIAEKLKTIEIEDLEASNASESAASEGTTNDGVNTNAQENNEKKILSIAVGNTVFESMNGVVDEVNDLISAGGLSEIANKRFLTMLNIIDSMFNLDSILRDPKIFNIEVGPDSVNSEFLKQLASHILDNDLKNYILSVAENSEEKVEYVEEYIPYLETKEGKKKLKYGLKGISKKDRKRKVKVTREVRTPAKPFPNGFRQNISNLVDMSKLLLNKMEIEQGKTPTLSMENFSFDIQENSNETASDILNDNSKKKSIIINFVEDLIKKGVSKDVVDIAGTTLAERLFDKGEEAFVSQTKDEIREAIKNNIIEGNTLVTEKNKAYANLAKNGIKITNETLSSTNKEGENNNEGNGERINIGEDEETSTSNESNSSEDGVGNTIDNSNEEAIKDSESKETTIKDVLGEQVKTIQPQTSQYNINKMYEKEYVRNADAFDTGDTNTNVDPHETEKFLDNAGAFDFVNSGALAASMSDKKNKYAGQIYIVTDDKLNNFTSEDNNTNYEYAVDSEKDGKINSFYIYENAKYIQDKYGIKISKNTTDGKPLRLYKKNGKNVSVKDVIEGKHNMKVSVDGKEVDLSTIASKMRRKSIQPKLFFAVKLANGNAQIIGLAPLLSGTITRLGSNSKYFKYGMPVQQYADIMTGNLSSSADKKSLVFYMGGLPLKLTDTSRIKGFGNYSEKNKSFNGYKNLKDGYEVECYDYYTNEDNKTKLLEDGIKVSAIDNNTIEVTDKDGKVYVYTNKVKTKKDGEKASIIHPFHEFYTESQLRAEFDRKEDYKNLDKDKKEFEFQKYVEEKRRVIGKLGLMLNSMFEKDKDSYNEDGDRKICKIPGMNIMSVNQGGYMTIKKGEQPSVLNDSFDKKEANGKTMKLSDLISTGLVSIGMVLEKDGIKIVRNSKGDKEIQTKGLHAGMIVLSTKGADGVVRDIPLIKSKYSKELYGDQKTNECISKAVDLLLANKGKAIDINDKDNPLFAAFREINKVITIPLNTKIETGIDENGVVTSKKFNADYQEGSNSLIIKDGAQEYTIDLNNDKDKIVQDIKDVLAEMQRPMRITYSTDLNNAENVNNLIKRGILKTNLKSLNQVNAFFRVGNKENYTEEAKASDRKVYKKYSELIKEQEKLSNKDRVLGKTFIKAGNVNVTVLQDSDGRSIICDDDGNQLSSDRLIQLRKDLGITRQDGSQVFGKMNVNLPVFVTNLINIKNGKYQGLVFGERKESDPKYEKEAIHKGIIKIRPNTNVTTNYVYYDSVKGMAVPKSEYDKLAPNHDGEAATDEKVEEVASQPNTEEEAKKKQEEETKKAQEQASAQTIQTNKADSQEQSQTQNQAQSQSQQSQTQQLSSETSNVFDEEFDDEEENERLIDNTNYEQIDIEKESKWAENNLPWLSLGNRVKVLHNLDKVANKGVKAWGLFKNGCIYLSDTANSGTLYHEAYHAVSNLCLSFKERNALYDDVRSLTDNSKMNNKECEEYLAERFREYVQSNEEDKSSITKKIARWFSELFQKIFGVKRISERMNGLFRNICNGKYSVEPTIISSTYNQSTELNEIGSEEEYNDYIESMKNEKSLIKDMAYTSDYRDSEGNYLVMTPTENSPYTYMNSDMYNIATRTIGEDTSVFSENERLNRVCKPCLVNVQSGVKVISKGGFKGIKYAKTTNKPYILGSKEDIEGFRNYIKNNKSEMHENKYSNDIADRGITLTEYNKLPNVIKDKLNECI